MTLQEIKNHIYDIVSTYFSGATVVWAEQFMAKPPMPLVTLKIGNLDTGNMPIEGEVEGEHTAAYNCSTSLEVNLYTKGTEIKGEDNEIIAMDDSSISDLIQFVVYLHSPFVLDKLSELDICILLNGQVQGLSGLLNDNRYEYRAMAEFDVTFTTNFFGAYNVIEKTSSGGGSDELIGAKSGYFEEAEIEEEKE